MHEKLIKQVKKNLPLNAELLTIVDNGTDVKAIYKWKGETFRAIVKKRMPQEEKERKKLFKKFRSFYPTYYFIQTAKHEFKELTEDQFYYLYHTRNYTVRRHYAGEGEDKITELVLREMRK